MQKIGSIYYSQVLCYIRMSIVGYRYIVFKYRPIFLFRSKFREKDNLEKKNVNLAFDDIQLSSNAITLH